VDPFLAGELVLLVCALLGAALFVVVRSFLLLRGASLHWAWRLGWQDLRGGRNEDAEKRFRRSAARAAQRFGASDRRTLAHECALARALIALKRTDEAKSFVDRALATMKSHAGVHDPWLMSIQLSAADLSGARGDARRALEHLEKARVHSGNPGVVAAIDLDRAAILERLGDRGGAAEVLRDIDPRFILAHAPARALPLARARLQEGDAMGAAALYRQLVERERRHRRESTTLACYRGLAGNALYRAGKHTEARYALTEAIATYDAIAPPGDTVVAPLLVVLARTHLALGERAAAEIACRRALATAGNADPSGSPYRERAEPNALESVRDEAALLLSEITALQA
jgi:tetratricopeptide (TPR) repeat protein